MQFKEVRFLSYNLVDMKNFYCNTLLMPLIKEDSNSFTVQSGNTLLHFRKTDKQPFYHFALKIQAKSFLCMLKRIEQSGNILTKNNEDPIIPSEFWKESNRFYFTDPDQNIVEIISDQQISEGDLWGRVCEIGLPSKNVEAMSKFLRPIHNEFNAESKLFQFYGDYLGVFVLVIDSRNWFPTSRPAEIHEVEIVLEGKTPLTLQHAEFPYKIRQTTC